MSEKEWTVMIYMAGDNNLSVDMAYAMEQIKAVAAEAAQSPNLFVYYDGNSPSIPTLYCDFSEPGRPSYVRSFMVPDKLYPVPERQNENAADRRSVLNFVDWCVNKVEVDGENGEITYGRRAKKYALIFSGHSLGFEDIGLFRDETSGRSMKMADMYFLLQRLTSTKKQLKGDVKGINFSVEEEDRETTLLLGQKLDILGFDSCVMGMLEVGYQFNDLATTMIASEGSVPSAGWTYAKILGGLVGAGGEDGDPNLVAEHFVREFIRSQDAYTIGGVSVDLAAWDLSKLGDLVNGFDDLSAELVYCFEDPSSRLYSQMQRVILKVHWLCQSYMYDQNVDLGDFCRLLSEECELVLNEVDGEDMAPLATVSELCRNVLAALQQAVVLSGFSGGGYQYSSGISVFFPWSLQTYNASKKNYEALWFAKDAGNKRIAWSGFLKKYLTEVAIRRAAPVGDTSHGGYRYASGIAFDEHRYLTASLNRDVKMAGQEGSKMAGQEGSKMAGQEGSKMAGQEGSKMAGQEGSKMAGQEGSKMAGQEGSKMAGQEGSKMAGQEGSKMAGQEGSKLGTTGSGKFFDSLRLFKNIEARWDVSGFTRKPDDES